MALRAILALIASIVLLASCTSATAIPESVTTAAPTTVAAPVSTAEPFTLACPDADTAFQGPIVFVGEGNLIATSEDGANVQQLMTLPATEWAQHPAWSPDGQTLAYTFSVQNPDEALSWLPLSLICGLDRTTGEGRMLAQGQAYESLAEPAWSGDGGTLFVTRTQHDLDANKQYLGSATELARYDVGTNSGVTVATGASSAAMSHDGKRLAYVVNNPETFEIQVTLANPDGSDAQIVRAPGTGWGAVSGMNWSHDSTKLVFAASSEAARAASPRAQRILDTLLLVRVAEAHGAPMDLWTVAADGQEVERLTNKNYDDPRAAWNPDGTVLALVVNTGGVTIIDPATGSERLVTDLGDFGGITWAAR